MNYSKIRNLSFNEIDSLVNYMTKGTEYLIKVVFKRDSILIITNTKKYYCEELSSSPKRYGYAEIWAF